MASHLLSLARMRAEGPGSLDVVFGPDGGHEDAPLWLGPIWAGNRNRYLCPFPWSATHTDASSVGPDWVAVAINGSIGERWEHDGVALDLRVPSVAARLLAILCRAISPKLHLYWWQTAADLSARVSRGEWNDDYAACTVELVHQFAPQIAALKLAQRT